MLEADALGLLNGPAIRAFVMEDWERQGAARWAAVTAAFLRHVKHELPALYGQYVWQLVPCVAATVSPLIGLFRMGPGNEFRLAVRDRQREQLRLSMLGPMALFFLESAAQGHLAWETLVESENAPAQSTPFGWAPTLDPLPLSMRLALLGYTGRAIKRKALLYSPLARYLIELGMLQRVNVQRDSARSRDNRWLLSEEFVARAGGGSNPLPLMIEIQPPSPWEADEAAVDLRTGRRAPTPAELVELAEARNRLLAAARSLVGRYAAAPRPQVKRLALWAHVADVDPADLLASPQSLGEEVLAALAEAAIRRRCHASRLHQLNAALGGLASTDQRPRTVAFTSAQSRTTLTRLRQEFRQELGAGWES
mgnify:CR=1 FL=1